MHPALTALKRNGELSVATTKWKTRLARLPRGDNRRGSSLFKGGGRTRGKARLYECARACMSVRACASVYACTVS